MVGTLPFFRRPTPAPQEGRVAIVDIGSNSVRLVIYDGPARIPFILFNEKIMAGLGKGLARDGALDPQAMERTLSAIARFRRLARDMGVAEPRAVATAAVRDATNGAFFLARLREQGLAVELLPGDVEAALSGDGVLAGIPRADGIVGDLGGGSLELIRVGEGEVHERDSFPLGVLRVAAIRQKGPRALDQYVAKALGRDWRDRGRGRPFYLVGGSWRALARLHMALDDYPLPILHQYRMGPGEAARLVRVVSRTEPKRLREVPGVAASRAVALADAAALLAILVRRLEPSELVVSAYGLREGLLHQSLPPDVRRLDPLIEAAREEGSRQGRFPEHGDLLDRWIAPLFGHEDGEQHRLRHTACLLADVGWRAHPDFRAERGLDTALHGNWVGIDALGRAMLGHALWTSFGGEGVNDVVAKLVPPEVIARAARWGLAMRLGQRLSGGVAQPLQASRLSLTDRAVVLHLGHGDQALYGEAVERRHKALAVAHGLRAVVA